MMCDDLEAKILGEVDLRSKIEFRVFIDEGAVIENSVIRGPTMIGKNTKIVDSYVGPFTSVNDHCEIRGSEIEHSIILQGSRIMNIRHRISDSLIGKNVEIAGSARRTKCHQFMVGDSSRIELT
jgi:glucose-1-phosphate thymidylyltransferase